MPEQLASYLGLAAQIIGIVAVVPSVIRYFLQKKRDRCNATLEAYYKLETDALLPLNHYEPSQIKKIVENSGKKEYKQEYIDLRAMTARIEHFCVGIQKHVYDKRIAYELGGEFLNGTIKARIEPIIDKSNSFGHADHYSNTHAVMKQWDKMSIKQKRRK